MRWNLDFLATDPDAKVNIHPLQGTDPFWNSNPRFVAKNLKFRVQMVFPLVLAPFHVIPRDPILC